jgi:hypothetical protein
MERTTADCTKAALKDIEASVPGLDRVSQMFKLRSQASITDRYSANGRCETALQVDTSSDTPWCKTHLPCDVHKVSTCQTQQFELVKEDISGMISLSLVMSDAGSTAALQQVLKAIFAEQLVIIYDEPPEEYKEYREHVYDLFLSSSTKSTGSRANRKARRLQSRQRLVLNHYLNGDIQSDVPTHWCSFGCCPRGDRAFTLSKFQALVTPALVPHGCPKFPRSRWTGSDMSVDWCGLLGVHHSLLRPLIVKWLNIVPRAPLSATSSTDLSWNRLVLALCDEARQAVDVDVPAQPDPELAQQPGAATGVTDATGEFDWVEFNRTMKSKAADWVQTDPGAVLVIMKLAMTPLVYLMHDALRISGTAWEREQQQRVVHGLPRSYRMLEAFDGKQAAKFEELLRTNFHSLQAALPISGMTLDMKMLHFRLLSRCGGVVHQLLTLLRAGYPYKLFAALLGGEGLSVVEDDVRDSQCLFDELAHVFTNMFDELLGGEESQAMLMTLASMLEVDIAAIEAKHAATRRIIQMRSLQTWASSLETVSADWTCRQHSMIRAETHNQPDTEHNSNAQSTAGQRKSSSSSSRSTTESRVGGGGGAFRAFIHVAGAGAKFTKASMKVLSEKYRALDGDELAYFQELGSLGSLSHRHGHTSFGQVPSAARGGQATGDVAAAPLLASADSIVPWLDGGGDIMEQLSVLKSRLAKESASFEHAEHQLALDLEKFKNTPSAPTHHHSLFQNGETAQLSGFVQQACPVPTVEWCPPCAELLKDSVGLC